MVNFAIFSLTLALDNGVDRKGWGTRMQQSKCCNFMWNLARATKSWIIYCITIPLTWVLNEMLECRVECNKMGVFIRMLKCRLVQERKN